MDYTVKYQKRKTIGIYITKEAEIEVRCPKGTSKKYIEDFIEQSGEWIEKTLEKKKRIISAREEFSPTECARFMGKYYPIIRSGNKFGFDGKSFIISESAEDSHIKYYLAEIYKRLAKNYIVNRTKFISEQIKIYPSNIRITSAATRWGSCSGKNSLNFSWRLIMADSKAIDYVIVHELSHIIEHNHSRAFWDIVCGFMPDYKDAENILNNLSKELSRESWE